MTTEPQSQIDELEAQIMAHLDEALSMQLGLSEDDSDYDLNFITQKLAMVSVFHEKLSDIMLRLTRISVEVVRVAGSRTTNLNLLQAKLKGSPEYTTTPRPLRSDWLSNQLEAARVDQERWLNIRSAVSMVKDAVAERAGTMKRLDSDLRLQTKLLEAKVSAGASSPYSFKGTGSDEINLNDTP